MLLELAALAAAAWARRNAGQLAQNLEDRSVVRAFIHPLLEAPDLIDTLHTYNRDYTHLLDTLSSTLNDEIALVLQNEEEEDFHAVAIEFLKTMHTHGFSLDSTTEENIRWGTWQKGAIPAAITAGTVALHTKKTLLENFNALDAKVQIAAIRAKELAKILMTIQTLDTSIDKTRQALMEIIRSTSLPPETITKAQKLLALYVTLEQKILCLHQENTRLLQSYGNFRLTPLPLQQLIPARSSSSQLSPTRFTASPPITSGLQQLAEDLKLLKKHRSIETFSENSATSSIQHAADGVFFCATAAIVWFHGAWIARGGKTLIRPAATATLARLSL